MRGVRLARGVRSSFASLPAGPPYPARRPYASTSAAWQKSHEFVTGQAPRSTTPPIAAAERPYDREKTNAWRMKARPQGSAAHTVAPRTDGIANALEMTDTADICGAGVKPPRMLLTDAPAAMCVRRGFVAVGVTSAVDAEAAASTKSSRGGANHMFRAGITILYKTNLGTVQKIGYPPSADGFSLSPTKMGLIPPLEGLLAGSLYFDPRRARAQSTKLNFSLSLERTPCLAWGGNRAGSLSSPKGVGEPSRHLARTRQREVQANLSNVGTRT
eukprot:scaffold17052_cov114-Isochrysis_galbana.AAC.5